MRFELRPIDVDEMDAVFAVYESYLHSYIEQVFGWDTDFQIARFESSYDGANFSWIVCSGVTMGLLCTKESPVEIHVHLLILFEDHQRKGIGKAVMSYIQEDARIKGKSIALSSFKANTKAVKFYRSLGYVERSEDENFYDFVHCQDS